MPAQFAAEANSNVLSRGPVERLYSPIAVGKLSMMFGASGAAETGRLDLLANVTVLQGQATASAGAPVAGLADQSGVVRLGIVNGNGLMIDGLGSASPIGSYVGKHPIYNAAGALIGYMPVYS
ncbi:hypothetical protein PEC18_12000 [Paucibacter sp. O1-1]|nr:hypothetical protein [Paucibacter sp. O1-1]MDA3826538.1 hypothetical protein [Paucibacter sp. O1-1]